MTPMPKRLGASSTRSGAASCIEPMCDRGPASASAATPTAALASVAITRHNHTRSRAVESSSGSGIATS